MEAHELLPGVYRIDGVIVAVNPSVVAAMTGPEIDAYLRSVIEEARSSEFAGATDC